MSSKETASKEGASKGSVQTAVAPEIIKEVIIKEVEKKEETPSTDFLTSRKITVQYVMKESDYIKDPKHVGYGGLFSGAAIAIPVPLMDNQKMKNMLTKKELKGLEFVLGKSLSIYGDFWKSEYKKGGMFPIFISKDGFELDLSNPSDYIKYKVLLASPIVANSIDEIKYRATNRFVMVEEGETIRREKDKVGSKVLAFEKYVEFKNDRSVLRHILRNLGRYTSRDQKLDFLQVETAKQIEKDP